LFIWQVSYRGDSNTRPDYSTKELSSFNLSFICQVSYRGESYTRPDYSLAERNRDSAAYSPVIYSSKVVAEESMKVPTYEERINSVLRERCMAG
jgi:hypothetical protein